MAVGTQSIQGSLFTTTVVDKFLTTEWRSLLHKYYDEEFVMRGFVAWEPNTQGLKTIVKPRAGRLGMAQKTAETPVTYQVETPDEWTMDINQHWYSAFAVEDLAKLQSAYNIMQHYSKELGYAMARHMELFILGYRAAINYVSTQVVWSSSNGTSSGTPYGMDEAAIMAAREILLDANVPEKNIVLILGQRQYSDLLADVTFLNQDFYPGYPLKTAQIPVVYGIPLYRCVSIKPNSPTGLKFPESAAGAPTPGYTSSVYLPTQDSYTSLSRYYSDGTSTVTTALMCDRDWLVVAEQQRPRIQDAYDLDYLAHKIVADTVYDAKIYRTDRAVVINTNS